MPEYSQEIVNAVEAVKELALVTAGHGGLYWDSHHTDKCQALIAKHIAPLIERERVAAIRDCAATLCNPVTASFNDFMCASKLRKFADDEAIKAGCGE